MNSSFDPQAVLVAVKSVLPHRKNIIALHEPLFQGNEWSYVKECLDTGWVSSVGSFVGRFEKELAEFTGVQSAVAVMNGTAALHICLLLAGVQPGDEVLVPALTFVATANAVNYCGAVPHFVDSEINSFGMDPVKLEAYLKEISNKKPGGCYNKRTGRRIKAAVPMHTFGHPAELDPLVEVSDRFHITLVEDAAESLGSYYKGKHTGNRGTASAVSFNGNKVITTGGGGAILTNDETLGRQAKHLTTTARATHPWEICHDAVGYNYRLPNINAALGCAQLEQLPEFLKAKRSLANRYQDAFMEVEGVTFVTEPKDTRSNYWLNSLLLDRDHADQRDRILEMLNKNGIQARPAWKLMHLLPMYGGCPRMDLSVAEELVSRIINIPSSASLSEVHA